jgi:endonuclease/exonuclease/phosphatase family metal-dependent hydrolase
VRDDAAGASLTVASMNMHYGVSTLGRPYDVEAAVMNLNADIVALQEVWSPDDGHDPVAAAAKSLGASLHREALWAAPSHRELAGSGPGSSGMTVLSRFPVTGYDVIDLGQLRGDRVRRRAQLLTIDLGDRGLVRLAATHLSHRLVSPVQLGALVRRLDGTRVPTIIAGDLNMPGVVAGRLPRYSRTVHGRTWPAELPIMQLDHILAGPGVNGAGGRVLPAAGSDHLPVRARLILGG